MKIVVGAKDGYAPFGLTKAYMMVANGVTCYCREM